MWDRPDILNGVASALFAAAILLAAYAAIHYVVRLPAFPVRELRVTGHIEHVTSEQIESVARREIRGTFFTLDLAATRAAFEKLPWVRKVQIRRQWPDRVEVAFEEHVPLARWGNEALVNTHAETFTAAYDGKLPVFIGPPGSAREIATQYAAFQQSLAAIGQVPVQVQVSARRAWQIKLESGLRLELGREKMHARLERFVAVYDRTLAPLQRRLDYVDLRYPNGFAVRIPELRNQPVEPRRPGSVRKG